MIELLGSMGWGLIASGSVSHVWHHRRLRLLLGMHLDHERAPAAALTAIETALAAAIAVAFLTEHPSLRWLALTGLALAAGFIIWIARLLLSGSRLPCACSFSEAPTSMWSFARSCCVALVGCLALVNTSAPADWSTGDRVAVLLVGWAVASAMFVLPEALTWPDASKALLARVDTHLASETVASENSARPPLTRSG